MPDIVEGAVDALQVVATNKAGRTILPLPDAAVTNTVTQNIVSAVDLATGNFTFTADGVLGSDSLVATVANVSSAAYVENVVPDNTVTTVAIQPQVAAVTIQPQPVPGP